MENFENISEEIKMLFVNYITGEITEDELIKLQDWISGHPEREEYLDRLSKTWELSKKRLNKSLFNDDLQWRKIQAGMVAADLHSQNNSARKIAILSFLKNAAFWILIFGLGAVLSWLILMPSRQNYNALTEITSPLGAKSHVKLPDGTEVWLNAGSKIVYSNNFNEKERKIQLIGEAYFNVFTNKSKPFTVQTSDIVVRAFGTRFNVKAYPDEKTITTILEEGKIDVMLLKGGNDKSSIVLKPNQKIVYFKEANYLKGKEVKPESAKDTKEEKASTMAHLETKIKLDTNINTELYTSWKEKQWIIESIPFETLVPMLERRFNLKITIKDPELNNYKFTGTIQNETVEQIMDALTFTAPMNYSIVQDTITLTVNQKLKTRYKQVITSKGINSN